MEAIKVIDTTTKVNVLQIFVGIFNNYRDMWRKHTHTLSPLTKLCSTKVEFSWPDVEKNA